MAYTKLDIIEKFVKYLKVFTASFFIISFLNYLVFYSSSNIYIYFTSTFKQNTTLSFIAIYFYIVFDMFKTPRERSTKKYEIINRLSHRHLYYFINILSDFGFILLIIVFIAAVFYPNVLYVNYVILIEFFGLLFFMIPNLLINNYQKSVIYIEMYLKTEKRSLLIKCFDYINNIFFYNIDLNAIKKMVNSIDAYKIFKRTDYDESILQLINALSDQDKVKIGYAILDIMKIENKEIKLTDIFAEKEINPLKNIQKVLHYSASAIVIPIILYVLTTYIVPYLLQNIGVIK